MDICYTLESRDISTVQRSDLIFELPPHSYITRGVVGSRIIESHITGSSYINSTKIPRLIESFENYYHFKVGPK